MADTTALLDGVNASRPVADRQDGIDFARRLPSLDGWRALSIILVLGMHSMESSGFPPALKAVFRFSDGDLGVRCFFIISGFLITWLLINERDNTGRVSLKHFYIRRFLRIFPVYFAFMGTLWLLHIFTPFSQSPRAWLMNLTFTSNFYFTCWTSAHLCSLSVEEQFYLIWPALFVLFAVGKKPATALKILMVPLFVAPVWRIVTFKQYYPAVLSPLFTHGSFFNYFDCLAMGCLSAFLLRFFENELAVLLVARARRVMTFGVLLVLAPYLCPAGIPLRIIAGFGPSMQGLGFAALMLQSVMPSNAKMFSPLNWKWVRHIGVLSYSIYIWQQIFCTKPEVFGLGQVWWMTFPGWLAASLLAAHVSYYALERPLFRLRSRFR